jgi:Arc/MetJ family transcription regulator
MTQVLVDIDHEDLAKAKDILRTTKNTEAVRLAIREVIATRTRRDVLDMFSTGAFADLADPAVRSAAWTGGVDPPICSSLPLLSSTGLPSCTTIAISKQSPPSPTSQRDGSSRRALLTDVDPLEPSGGGGALLPCCRRA